MSKEKDATILSLKTSLVEAQKSDEDRALEVKTKDEKNNEQSKYIEELSDIEKMKADHKDDVSVFKQKQRIWNWKLLRRLKKIRD